MQAASGSGLSELTQKDVSGQGMAGLLGQVRTRAVDGDGRAHVFCFASVGRRRLEATSER